MQVHYESDLFRISYFSKLPGSVIRTRISDPMQLSPDVNCTVKGSVFVSLLGGAAYAAVSCDSRSVLHLRFYQRVYGFMVLC